jgi:hypothetical protein
MYLIHWWGDVWQIGDDDDVLIMMFVKITLLAIVTAIGLALLAFWLGYKVIQWNPRVGVPLVVGVLAFVAIAAASGQ